MLVVYIRSGIPRIHSLTMFATLAMPKMSVDMVSYEAMISVSYPQRDKYELWSAVPAIYLLLSAMVDDADNGQLCSYAIVALEQLVCTNPLRSITHGLSRCRRPMGQIVVHRLAQHLFGKLLSLIVSAVLCRQCCDGLILTLIVIITHSHHRTQGRTARKHRTNSDINRE